MNMRIDYEGELTHEGHSLYVQADFEWESDCVVVTQIRAYDLDNNEVAKPDDAFKDRIADIIQNEIESS